MKKRKLILILLCAVLALGMFGFTACGKSGDTGAQDGGSDEPKEQTYQVTLFFANEDYIATGDESLEKFKVYQAELTSVPGKAYRDALELLKTPEEGYGTVITDNIGFNDVYLEGDTVFVDLSSDGLSGGSLEETFLIGQIVDTLLNSFAEVKQVQFLVDGETAETLMGHVGAADPFTKDLF
jgi:spore germination protein GerM